MTGVKLNPDDARRLVLALMRDKDPLWVRRASIVELQAWLGNYAANLSPLERPEEGSEGSYARVVGLPDAGGFGVARRVPACGVPYPVEHPEN